MAVIVGDLTLAAKHIEGDHHFDVSKPIGKPRIASPGYGSVVLLEMSPVPSCGLIQCVVEGKLPRSSVEAFDLKPEGLPIRKPARLPGGAKGVTRYSFQLGVSDQGQHTTIDLCGAELPPSEGAWDAVTTSAGAILVHSVPEGSPHGDMKRRTGRRRQRDLDTDKIVRVSVFYLQYSANPFGLAEETQSTFVSFPQEGQHKALCGPAGCLKDHGFPVYKYGGSADGKTQMPAVNHESLQETLVIEFHGKALATDGVCHGSMVVRGLKKSTKQNADFLKEAAAIGPPIEIAFLTSLWSVTGHRISAGFRGAAVWPFCTNICISTSTIPLE
jgi:hypothetical protein